MSYAQTQTNAAAILARKGQTVTISGTTGTSYDTATATVTGTAYSHTAKAVILPMTPYRQAKDSNIQAGDEQMLLAALDTSGVDLPQPPLNATVTLADGSTYTLVSIDPLHPDGTELLYDCAVRK